MQQHKQLASSFGLKLSKNTSKEITTADALPGCKLRNEELGEDKSSTLIVIKEANEQEETGQKEPKPNDGFAFEFNGDVSSSQGDVEMKDEGQDNDGNNQIIKEHDSESSLEADEDYAGEEKKEDYFKDNITISQTASVKSSKLSQRFQRDSGNMKQLAAAFKINTPSGRGDFAADDLMAQMKKMEAKLMKIPSVKTKSQFKNPANRFNNLTTPEMFVQGKTFNDIGGSKFQIGKKDNDKQE